MIYKATRKKREKRAMTRVVKKLMILHNKVAGPANNTMSMLPMDND